MLYKKYAFYVKCVHRTIKVIFIAENRIIDVNAPTLIGVIIDYNCTGPHILLKSAETLQKTRKSFDQKTLFTLYYTFVYSYLDYCIHVWGKAYNVDIHDLIILQNKVVHVVHGS